MISEKFNFHLPNREELETAKLLAETCPELLDGRDMWVYKEFLAGESE